MTNPTIAVTVDCETTPGAPQLKIYVSGGMLLPTARGMLDMAVESMRKGRIDGHLVGVQVESPIDIATPEQTKKLVGVNGEG